MWGAAALAATARENMTLCRDFCGGADCVSYDVPLGTCFSPRKLWPNDPSWGEYDVRDTCVNETHFQRAFFDSTDASCGRESSSYVLPLHECIGPFGKPRPWGIFNMSCNKTVASHTVTASDQREVRDVIVVTDLGDDIDDHWALSMLLSMPSIRVRLVLCDSYSAPGRADILAEFFIRANIQGVPIGIGSNRTGDALIMKGYARPGALGHYSGPVYQDGVGALISLAMSPRPAGAISPALVVISPCPSVREALRREPRIASRLEVFAMGGSVLHGLNTSTPPQREWNILADAVSAQALYHAKWPINDAPLDSAGSAQIDAPAYAAILAAERRVPLVGALLDAYRYWLPRCPWPDATLQPLPANVSVRSSVIFDAVAVSLLPAFAARAARGSPFLTTKTMQLRVTGDGWTRIDETPRGRPVRCALGWAARDEWQASVVALLTRARA